MPVVRMKATLRPGASMRARDARPYGGGRSVWRAEVVARASLARRVVAPYGEVLQAASYSRARNARPYEIWTQRLARRGRGPGQLLLPLRGNSPSRALRLFLKAEYLVRRDLKETA